MNNHLVLGKRSIAHMRLLVAVSLLLLISMVARAEILKVVDAEDSTPLKAATVSSKSGVIIGLTDDNGEIKISNQSDYPVRISYLGYKPANYTGGGQGVIKMVSTVYDLKEVVVDPKDRPVERIVCYMREYISASTDMDTTLYFNEYMADFFIVKGKVKGVKTQNKPRLLSSRRYAKISNREVGDSIYKPDNVDPAMAWAQIVSLPEDSFDPVAVIGENKTYGSVNGKYWLKEQIRINPATVMRTVNMLADYKDHSISPLIFKMLGFTLDITECTGTWLYKKGENGVCYPDDLLMGVANLKVLGRGKWIKKAFKADDAVDIYASYEVYPVEVEYLSAQEAKEVMKERPTDVKITVSPNALPLPEGVRRVVDIIDKKGN